MSTFKKLLPFFGALAATLLVTSCSGGPAANEATASDGDFSWSDVEPVELTASSAWPATIGASLMEQNWMDLVTENTDGKVTFEYYSDATLHPLLEGFSALTSGLTDITMISPTWFADQIPETNWADEVARTTLRDYGFANMNIGGHSAAFESVATDDSLARQEMIAAGVVPLLPMTTGPAVMTCSEEFESADDLSGRTIRVSSVVEQKQVETLGMSAVMLPSNEQYEALQRGVVDCAMNAVSLVLNGLLEVAPWATVADFTPGATAGFAISATKWDELIPEVQQVMLDARGEAMEVFLHVLFEDFAELGPAAEEAGGSVVDPETVNTLLTEHWAEQPNPAENAPASVEDPQAEVDRISAIVEQWYEFSVAELGVPSDGSIVELLDAGPGIISDEAWEFWKETISNGLVG